METIEHPKALKTIFVYLINTILFVIYYLVNTFIIGFVFGIGIVLVGKDVDTVLLQYTSLEKTLSLLALVILILLTIFQKKNIYFSLHRS